MSPEVGRHFLHYHYLEARQHLNKSLSYNTSDLQTEEEEEEDIRPKRKPKMIKFLEIRMMTVRKIKGREPVLDPNPHHNHQLLLSHHHLPMCQVAAQLSPLHRCRCNVEGQENSKPLLQASCTHLTGKGEDVTQAPFLALLQKSTL
ncbi:hypothetical protein AMECASPLE_024783 [Ameca splendens]|uniref:Uncharacterized protein n=1 Tax=Ameca splendens TaxID=208324 RepID=A0ABV0ZPP5_9TELE